MSRNQHSKATLDRVLAALPRCTAVTPRELARHRGLLLSPASLRGVLHGLVRSGLATTEGESGKRRYRRAE